MEQKKNVVVIEDECEIQIPKAGMVVQFDGEKCLIGFVANTDLVVDGNLRIATQGNFEIVSTGDAVVSTINGKVHLGKAEKIYEKVYKNKEVEDDGRSS